MSAKDLLQSAVEAALTQFGTIEGVAPDVLKVVPATNPQFGDYQFNGALPLAKALKQKPRDIATKVLEQLDVAAVSETPEIAGPGFINFRLKREWLEGALASARTDERLGVPEAAAKRKIIIDYPSPNVAKPLHVGHIRTTFIGDAIARMLRFEGHEVVSDNHIGDWGTPIGKVILGWQTALDREAFEKSPLDEMGRLYALINEQGEKDPAVLNAARAATMKLQSGDPEITAIWEILRDHSMPLLNELWLRLGVQTDETLGESFYQPMLEGILAELESQGTAVESEGALIIPFEKPDSLRERPMLVRKSDGSALYATTDLATVKYRMERWSPDEIIYVVDVRQSLHFQQLFAACQRWGYTDVDFNHVAFGTILGDNGKPISTRAGVTSKLELLVEEAQRRAEAVAAEKNAQMPEDQQLSADQLREVGQVLGIAGLKYADLSPNRTSDYVFSWEKMLALNGNSAVYLEYAYVRTRSIARNAASKGIEFSPQSPVILGENAEIELAKHLLRFGEAIDSALDDYRPHLLCDYLYELAGKFAAFYRDCPILKEPMPAREIQESRLALVAFTGDVLKQGLNLLGIETIEQM